MNHSVKYILAAVWVAVATSQTWAFGGFNLDVGKVISAGKNLAETSREISEAEEVAIGEGMVSVLLGPPPWSGTMPCRNTLTRSAAI